MFAFNLPLLIPVPLKDIIFSFPSKPMELHCCGMTSSPRTDPLLRGHRRTSALRATQSFGFHSPPIHPLRPRQSEKPACLSLLSGITTHSSAAPSELGYLSRRLRGNDCESGTEQPECTSANNEKITRMRARPCASVASCRKKKKE